MLHLRGTLLPLYIRRSSIPNIFLFCQVFGWQASVEGIVVLEDRT
jgi:hypothetical protein